MRRGLALVMMALLAVNATGQTRARLRFIQGAGQSVSNPIAAIRRVDWNANHPGVLGGAIGAIPSANWPTCNSAACNTVSGGTVTLTSINNALAACTLNGTTPAVISVPAGSFTLGGWTNGTSNCAIRGARADQTLLTLNNDASCSACGVSAFAGIFNAVFNWKGNIGNGPVNLSGTFTKGSTTLTFP